MKLTLFIFFSILNKNLTCSNNPQPLILPIVIHILELEDSVEIKNNFTDIIQDIFFQFNIEIKFQIDFNIIDSSNLVRVKNINRGPINQLYNYHIAQHKKLNIFYGISNISFWYENFIFLNSNFLNTSTVVHEISHFLGLDDNTNYNNIMFESYSATKKVLTIEEINNIKNNIKQNDAIIAKNGTFVFSSFFDGYFPVRNRIEYIQTNKETINKYNKPAYTFLEHESIKKNAIVENNSINSKNPFNFIKLNNFDSLSKYISYYLENRNAILSNLNKVMVSDTNKAKNTQNYIRTLTNAYYYTLIKNLINQSFELFSNTKISLFESLINTSELSEVEIELLKEEINIEKKNR